MYTLNSAPMLTGIQIFMVIPLRHCRRADRIDLSLAAHRSNKFVFCQYEPERLRRV
jgi:hypothetical protein